MDILLIAGLWLDGSAWDAVAEALRARGHQVVALSLPGQGAPAPGATLEDQRAAVLAAIDAGAGSVLVVGHSAACTLAWMAADARPDTVARVVMIGGFPTGDGKPYADFFPVVAGVVPFPGWAQFEDADVADLDEQRRAAIARTAIPVPEAVATGTVHLTNERRYDVPVTIICPEFSSAQAREWIDEGQVPELARASRVDYDDIESGHWPMLTRPIELADLVAAATDT